MDKRVSDVMTRAPITIDPEAPLATAAAVMQERAVRHLPVVADDGRILGMLSDRDLRSAVLAPVLAEHLAAAGRRRFSDLRETLQRLPVKKAMTWDVRTVEPDAPLAQAAALMVEHGVGCLPVVARGRLVGIVSDRDLLRALAESLPAVRGLDPDTYFW